MHAGIDLFFPVVFQCGQLRALLFAGGLLAPAFASAQGADAIDPQQIRQIIEQNRLLQQQVNAQQKTIEDLRAKINEVGASSAQQEQELQGMRAQMGVAPAGESQAASSGQETVRLGGVMGVAFFDSGPDGAYGRGDFRLDDAKVFLDAAVSNNVFLHTEMDLVTRETNDQNFHIGELYADIEGLASAWGDDQLLNVRAGRMYIPFGEEYEVRGVMDNPLISHSVSDIWGMDQGVEAFGQWTKLSYAAAVQDGGISSLHSAHSNKSLASRIGYDPSGWLHLSVSGMRTGQLSTADALSALWFGNYFFHALSPTASGFWANLGEADASAHWSGGDVKVAGGIVRFGDNSATAADKRSMSYYYLEAMQHITDKLYGAVRFSEVDAPKGYTLVGQANSSAAQAEYTSPNALATNLSRLSVGLGYQFSPPVVLKVDFSPEWGRTLLGDDKRDQENLFSTELGLKF